MFIDLRGLETVAFPAGLAWFEIDVVLAERWEHDFRFSEKHLRLHCVPVINLFPLESDPLTINSCRPNTRCARCACRTATPKFTPSIP